MNKENKQRRELASLSRLAVELEGANVYFRELCMKLELEFGGVSSMKLSPLIGPKVYTGDELASAAVCYQKICERLESVNRTYCLLRAELCEYTPSPGLCPEKSVETDYSTQDYKLRFDS